MQSEQSNSEGEGFTVLVTGASGFIAGHIIQELLQRGYTVRGSVRGEPCSSNYGYLFGLSGAKERLTLVTLDLTQSEGFDDAVRGCDFVIHAAQPMPDGHGGSSDEELIRVSLKGMQSLIDACKKETRLQRVVFTSSIAACNSGRWEDPNSQGRPHYLHPSEKTPTDTSEFYVAAYGIAKVKCEELLKQATQSDTCSFDCVTMMPATVLGPWLNPRNIPLSVAAPLLDFLTWKQKIGVCLPKQFSFVDVRDVAVIHVNALSPLSRKQCDKLLTMIRQQSKKEESGMDKLTIINDAMMNEEDEFSLIIKQRMNRRILSSGERYLICGESLWHRDVFQFIQSEFGNHLETPSMELPLILVNLLALVNPLVRMFIQKVAHSRRFSDTTRTSRDLGFMPLPIQITLKDTIEHAFFKDSSTLQPRFVDVIGRVFSFSKVGLLVGAVAVAWQYYHS